MEDWEGREVWFLNRDLLVVRPREPFLEWVRSVFEDEPLDAGVTVGWTGSFLIPEFDADEDYLAWLSQNCDLIFEMMVSAWARPPELWPEDRSWEAFQSWFEFERIETTWDLVDEPLSSDPPPPHIEGPFLEA
jgi:hypothetical protein